MDEIEGRVLAWLGQRYALAQEPGSLAAMLKECIHGKCSPDGALFGDLAEALDCLERAQAGL